uniref:Uncharacterized protein n=1 Tax=Avena sativa TaxID=4498 RepID=A0ACD6AUV5_AVESA
MDLSRLRSLTVFGDWRSFFISSNANMRLLRVLDLEDTSGVRDGDIEKIGIHLPRLKFLSLRGCREVTRLPNSLGDMRQLQTLDIKNTSIVIIPPAIIKLQKLQYIRAGNTIPSARQQDDGSDATSTSLSPAKQQQEEKTPAVRDVVHTTTSWSSIAGDLMVSCRYKLHQKCRRLYGDGDDNAHGVKVPVAGIHKLTALHTLGVVNVTRSGKTLLKELKKLTQLRKLRVSGINGKNWLDLCFVISGHPHLESLSVQLDDEQDQCSLVFCFFADKAVELIGCSPWRPDAVMSTTGRGRYSVLRIFMGRRGRTGHRATCGALPTTGPYLRLNRFQGWQAVKQKR